MRAYADTTFFTRLYFPLPETALAAERLRELRGHSPLPTTWLLELEVLNALELHASVNDRRCGAVRITPEDTASAQATFRADLKNQQFLRSLALPMSEVQATVEGLTQRHTATLGCRIYELLHVASALVLECDTFWTFDPKTRALAAAAGLTQPS